MIKNSLCVDASYSNKTGVMEYRGVWFDKPNKDVFREKFNIGTGNIGEFLAIVEALKYLNTKKDNSIIYTDSSVALKWIKLKRVNTNIDFNKDTIDLWRKIYESEDWLKSNKYKNKILKWKTSEWGEIKADFNRK
jgi:ribonuclease HI